jgi:hypothetical protein
MNILPPDISHCWLCRTHNITGSITCFQCGAVVVNRRNGVTWEIITQQRGRRSYIHSQNLAIGCSPAVQNFAIRTQDSTHSQIVVFDELGQVDICTRPIHIQHNTLVSTTRHVWGQLTGAQQLRIILHALALT